MAFATWGQRPSKLTTQHKGMGPTGPIFLTDAMKKVLTFFIDMLEQHIDKQKENNMTQEQMNAIAARYTDFPDLTKTHSGDDFTEVAKWTVESMLKAAYELGRNSVKEG